MTTLPVRPLVLLSNDDGFSAPGLVALHRALSTAADVVVCAPETNQSATSHSLSLHRVLRLRQHAEGIFAVDGTPADCVYVAVHAKTRVLPRRPDLVVSGMNHGLNLGSDVFYSGTVAAAREGAMKGIPAIAVSADTRAPFDVAAALGARLALAMLAQHQRAAAAPDGVAPWSRRIPLLNVNIPVPTGDTWTVRPTRLGSRLYEDDVVFREDPRGREYLWIGGTSVHHDEVAGSDTEAYDAGVVSITPLTLDLWASDHAGLADAVAGDASRL